MEEEEKAEVEQGWEEQGLAVQVVGREVAEEEEGKVGSLKHLELTSSGAEIVKSSVS